MMAKHPPVRKLNSGFTLGGEQAELDPLLEESFYEGSDYDALSSRDDPRCFVIARTGAGKTALLRHLASQNPEHVITLNPSDLSLPYITDSDVVRYLSELGVNLNPLFNALWKHVLLVEVLKRRYAVNTPDAKKNMLDGLRLKLKSNSGKRAALDYLDEFEGRFWCETHERLRQITNEFSDKITSLTDGKLDWGRVGVHGSSQNESGQSGSSNVELVAKYQRIVNETQLARLNKMLTVLDEDILDSPQHYTYIVIDDLDTDWVDERVANDLVRCLFRTVLDLGRIRNLKVIVALRTNLFTQLEFGTAGGGQEEKYRSLAFNLKWTKASLEAMTSERVRVAATRADANFTGVRDLLPPKPRNRPDALDYLVSRTLMRPRDLLAFLNECLAISSNKSRLTWEMIAAAEQPYSEKRFLALRDEWKSNFPDIQKVLKVFERCAAELNRDQVAVLLQDAALVSAEPDFLGTVWLTSVTEAMWNVSGESDWFSENQHLLKLLFEIGFIGCATKGGKKFVFSHDDPNFFTRRNVDADTATFGVHRAFHRVLSINEKD